VPHVGDVHHLVNAVAAALERAAEEIGKRNDRKLADMGK